MRGGRVDSPPTIYGNRVLFGSNDGYVTCLKLDDGALVWRMLAAPAIRKISCFERIESAWPVHGSVLVRDGIAYCSAGRSSYMDGGIHLYAIDPATGEILHQSVTEGPHYDLVESRAKSYYVDGANSDVLVSENDQIYMRQKQYDLKLNEQPTPNLSGGGERNMGLHIFSTAGLLDGSWYNRTFWMYSKRWPGFQLANQSSKSGQLLVVDDEKTYAVRAFYRRNTHSPMFFPGKEGYMVFADNNTTEPQIVGEKGAKEPVEWLPQSGFSAGENFIKLNHPSFGADKKIGYTRAEPPLWTEWLKIRVRAMVKAGDQLFVAGPPDEYNEKDPFAAFDGRRGGILAVLSAEGGKKQKEYALESPPVYDGLIAAEQRLFIAHVDGSLTCFEEDPNPPSVPEFDISDITAPKEDSNPRPPTAGTSEDKDSTVESSASVERVANPGFETETLRDYHYRDATVIKATGPSVAGDFAAKIDAGGFLEAHRFPVTAGETYDLRWDYIVDSPDGRTFGGALRWRDADGKFMSSAAGTRMMIKASTKKWMTWKVEDVVAPEGAAQADVLFFNNGDVKTGSMTVDNISVIAR